MSSSACAWDSFGSVACGCAVFEARMADVFYERVVGGGARVVLGVVSKLEFHSHEHLTRVQE